MFYIWRATDKDKTFFTLGDFLLLAASYTPAAMLGLLIPDDLLPAWARIAITPIGGTVTYFIVCSLLQRACVWHFFRRQG
jgi:hypothetical protein